MPMVYPAYGPGRGSGAMDALRKLGALDSSDTGARSVVNPQRLSENDTWGGLPGQPQTPTPRLPLSQTPPVEDTATSQGPLAGLLNAVPAYKPKITVQPFSQAKQAWAGERPSGY